MRTPYRTPLGQGAVVHAGGELIAIELPGRRLRGGTASAPPPVRNLVQALEAYYAGQASLIAPPAMIDRAGTTPLLREIYAHVAAIKPGETMTYGEVAAAVGRPGAARAVGAAMARNPFAPVIPCHRVVGSDGGLRGYGGGLDQKRRLLAMEADRA